jgi:hypothetical protein
VTRYLLIVIEVLLTMYKCQLKTEYWPAVNSNPLTTALVHLKPDAAVSFVTCSPRSDNGGSAFND